MQKALPLTAYSKEPNKRAHKIRKPEQSSTSARVELNLSGAELNPSGAELNPSRAELNPSIAELNPSRAELNSTRAELNSTWAELNSTRAGLNSTRTGLNPTQAELNSTQAELNSAWAELNSTRAELNSTRAGLNLTQTGISPTQAELNPSGAQLTPNGPQLKPSGAQPEWRYKSYIHVYVVCLEVTALHTLDVLTGRVKYLLTKHAEVFRCHYEIHSHQNMSSHSIMQRATACQMELANHWEKSTPIIFAKAAFFYAGMIFKLLSPICKSTY